MHCPVTRVKPPLAPFSLVKMKGFHMTEKRVLTPEKAGWIKWLLDNTDLPQDQIAAKVDVNQGRVTNVKKGERYPDVPAIRPPWAKAA